MATAEGEKGFAKHVASRAKRIARRHGGMSLTGYAVKQWEHGRYSDIYIREDILDFGMVIDTLETSVTWDNLAQVYEGVRGFVKSRPGTVCMTHASHFYPQGTNLYFILILRPEDAEEFFAFRAAIIDKVLECGGSTSHHHGVGNLFGPWLERYLGTTEMDVLRALKAHFDPDGIMNPGNPLAGGPEPLSATCARMCGWPTSGTPSPLPRRSGSGRRSPSPPRRRWAPGRRSRPAGTPWWSRRPAPARRCRRSCGRSTGC